MDDSSFGRAVQDLVSRDADLARIVQQHGRPVLWTRPPGFPALVLFILEQQVAWPLRRPPTRVSPNTSGACHPS